VELKWNTHIGYTIYIMGYATMNILVQSAGGDSIICISEQKNLNIARTAVLKWTRREIMKNKVRRNLKKNKFNWRKNIWKRGFKIHVDPNFLGMPYGVPNQVPFGMPLTYSPKIGVNVVPNPLNLQIKNGDKWEPLIPIGIWGEK
jgi:hypothetical protein